MNRPKTLLNGLKKFWKTLGPGLITGASDDDPSAITTFSQAGARFGLSTLWLALFAYPILAAIMEMCARIGIATNKGITAVIKMHYPKPILYIVVVLSCSAFLLNIGADISVLGEAGNLLFPAISPLYCSIIFTSVLFLLMLILPYKKLAMVLKLLCLSLLVYVIVPFLSPQHTWQILKKSFIPSITFNKDFLLILTGLIGAIISPYLFFTASSSLLDYIPII